MTTMITLQMTPHAVIRMFLWTILHTIFLMNLTRSKFVHSFSPENGYYLNWQPWSECSVPCGGGTHMRIRVCSPPKNGGASCVGEPEESQECNPDPCPGGYQGPILLLRHDAVARHSANGSAAFIKSFVDICWKDCDSVRSLCWYRAQGSI